MGSGRERNMDIADISNELVYRTYLINKDRIWEKLSDLSIIEYAWTDPMVL